MMNQAAKLLVDTIRKRTTTHISIAPAVVGWAKDNCNVEWEKWYKDDLFDDYIPQVYVYTGTKVKSEIARHIEVLGELNTKKLIIGLSIDHSK